MEERVYRLPGGWTDAEGQNHKDVVLRALSGREEALLAEQPHQESASLVSRILARCLLRIGPIQDISEDLTRKLLVADRHYLLLKLREITFGDRVQATIPCPWPHCGQKVDIDFSITDIPIADSAAPGPHYPVVLPKETDTENRMREVVFRLPTGADQEVLSPLLAVNEAEALSKLLARCIVQMDGRPAVRDDIDALSPLARMTIEKKMAEVAPKIDLDMEVSCPECGRDFTVPFDVQDFFFGELLTGRDLLYREVHYLAYHYHWSEREIMDMPKSKRRNYIEILADEIERLNSAV